jgi:hypothetical protein
MKDTTGREAKVGDTIVYGVKHSTFVTLTRAQVTEIGTHPLKEYESTPRTFMRVLTDDQRKVVLHYPTFMVIA